MSPTSTTTTPAHSVTSASAPTLPAFDVRKVPFSRAGAMMTINAAHPDTAAALPPGLFVRYVGGGAWPMEVFHLAPLRDGEPVAYTAEATPERLILRAVGGGEVEACFAGPDVLRLRGAGGLGLRLSYVHGGAYDFASARSDGAVHVNCCSCRTQFALVPLQGALALVAPWLVERTDKAVVTMAAVDGGFELAIGNFRVDWPLTAHDLGFAAAAAASARAFTDFAAALPAVPAEFAAARLLAGYALWSAIVTPRGILTRDVIYMSKRWMQRLWSWDCCFNAVGLASAHPDLAWDQLMILVDKQDPGGAFFDCIDDQNMVWNFAKPPIHGWALREMRRRGPVPLDRLAEIYPPLCRWTRWWTTRRDLDGDGMCEYLHGNDSGWDNATVYDAGVPVEGPDLAAYLALQMEELGEVAALLGRGEEAAAWRAESQAMIDRLIAHSWRDGAFIAPRSGSHDTASGGDSLIAFMPILLGRRLPDDIRRALIAGLRQPGRFLGEWGLATEALDSAKHTANGYWRGPIWAPPTMFVVDGLRAAGEPDLADDIARRFLRLCARSGFHENFDPRTGDGLKDPAYTWSASVFLALGADLVARGG